MPYSESKLLCCLFHYLLSLGVCLLDTTGNVHRRRMAENESAIVFESVSSHHSKGVVFCGVSRINYKRRIFHITSK